MFIVLEGSDGSGKTTQFKLLAERLRAAGYDIAVYDFPRYEEPSSYFVSRYLNGEYGPASEVSPYTASLFYALDRFEAAPLIRQSLADGKIVLANRYAGSNMAHQGAKFTNSGEQRGYFMWADSLEFQLLGVPRPSINLFLRVPAEVAFKLIKEKAARSYTDKSHDEHEADIEHLKQAVATYDTLCQLFPKDFKAIDCAQNNKILPVTEINNRIWALVKPMLPAPANPGKSAVVSLSFDKSSSSPKKHINGTVRSAEPGSKTSQLKDVSLLALQSLLPVLQSSTYRLDWPPKGTKARINYFIPPSLPPKLSRRYQEKINSLIDTHREMRRKAAKPSDELLGAVPLAALINAQVTSKTENLDTYLSTIGFGDAAELQQIGAQLVRTTDKRNSPSVRQKLDQPKKLQEIIRQIAHENLPLNSADENSVVKLLGTNVKNELDLLADCLYPHSNLSREEIIRELEKWPYQRKADTLKRIISRNPEVVLEKITYQFDIIDDQRSLLDLAGAARPFNLQLQPPTPRYGYDIPDEIEQSGLEDSYVSCFDASLELYSELSAAGHENAAGYVVLVGHKQRWQFSFRADSIYGRHHEFTGGAQRILAQLRRIIAETHPIVSQTVKQLEDRPADRRPDKRTNMPAGNKMPAKKRQSKSKK